MSDKMQHTATSMREKMISRYGDMLHHKHNKNHIPYRHHYRTHPCIKPDGLEAELGLNESTGELRKFNLQKTRKRLVKHEFH
ncbi:MAG: hypothetical protein ACHP6H_05675 [Legionellales bacterium]